MNAARTMRTSRRSRPLAALYAALCLAALAACDHTPPTLPAPQQAKGTTEASFTLPAQPAALTARLQASSKAVVAVDGWVELRVFANDKQCTWDQVVRLPHMGPEFSVMLNCEIAVEPSKPTVFRALQLTHDAQTREVAIEAKYEP